MCALWLSLWLCAARCALGDTGLITENRSAKIQVSCGFDISGVLLSAGKIGTGIWKVQDSCKVQETERQRLKCASQLQQLIGITSFSAAFASASASNCARTFSAPAKCAAGSLAFVGLLEFMAAALVNLKGPANREFDGLAMHPGSPGSSMIAVQLWLLVTLHVVAETGPRDEEASPMMRRDGLRPLPEITVFSVDSAAEVKPQACGTGLFTLRCSRMGQSRQKRERLKPRRRQSR
ncbi:unnamed protein product [Effrenium voratum]|nr:unnamed protein product [Effrenium voratum]